MSDIVVVTKRERNLAIDALLAIVNDHYGSPAADLAVAALVELGVPMRAYGDPLAPKAAS